MDNNSLIEIIRNILPAAIVFLTVYYMLRKYFDNEQKRRVFETKSNSQKLALPIRLQAYERLALLMERISIHNLIIRVKKGGMTANELHVALLAEILSEFEHNLSQQIYVSNETWQLVSNAKEETMRLINLSSGTLYEGADGLALSRAIFEIRFYLKDNPVLV